MASSTPTQPDFRALAAELHAAFNTYAVDESHHDLLVRARAALEAQPEPVELELDCDEIDVPAWHCADAVFVYREGYTAGWAAGVSASAACWGRPAITPYPGERAPVA
jgi:hypothetical protein